ncbi:hypothetical protein E3N88_04518 [Mikania micrantha]|uniref:Transposase-associated domain-containing protein n=1 Tax=Mikania micrantha TaxID=192012 RepID=A0A5N6PXG8_9ASTR|nr:hypothetical protein E3N88_04518 [Mikania micrantha]
MSSNREWMYTMRTTSNGLFNPIIQEHVTHFLDFAFANPNNVQSQTINGMEVFVIRCPCAKCQNRYHMTRDSVEDHLFTRGFMKNYLIWYKHGESLPTQDMGQCSKTANDLGDVGHHIDHVASQKNADNLCDFIGYDQMTRENIHQNHHPYYQQYQQDPNQVAQEFYIMLEQANKPLWVGSTKASNSLPTQGYCIGNQIAMFPIRQTISYFLYSKIVYPMVRICLETFMKPRRY